MPRHHTPRICAVCGNVGPRTRMEDGTLVHAYCIDKAKALKHQAAIERAERRLVIQGPYRTVLVPGVAWPYSEDSATA